MALRLNGSTSGYVEIEAPATAGSNTLTLPTGNGTSGQALQTNGSGALSWGPGVANDGQLCKAWVNFNGTGTVAIRASYNVSSITDNGTGDYTVNFTTALADANYSPVCMTQSDATRALVIRSSASDSAAPDLMSTTQFRVGVYTNSGGNADLATICVAIFR